MKKRIRTLLAVLALTTLSGQAAMAASVSFQNFSYTTKAYDENWKQVTSKTKADNEQNWYVTITSSSGLSSSKARVLLNSHYMNDPYNTVSAPVGLLSTTKSIKQSYHTTVNKGKNCKLYILGDENSGTAYTVKISGRYTS